VSQWASGGMIANELHWVVEGWVVKGLRRGRWFETDPEESCAVQIQAHVRVRTHTYTQTHSMSWGSNNWSSAESGGSDNFSNIVL
jgi:hypothetical protein